MAADPFVLWNNHVLDNTPITGNGQFELGVTNPENNNGGYNSIFLHMEFMDILPDQDALNPFYWINVQLETGDNAGNWWPIGHMFEPFRFAHNGTKNIIVVQPNIFNIDEGVPIALWDGIAVSQLISRQQGILGVNFRVRFLIREEKYGEPNAFQSMKVNVFGERYNV